QRTEAGGKNRFDALPDPAREHRGFSGGTDRDDDRRAVDDGREDEGRKRSVVDDIDGHAALAGGLGDRSVDIRKAGCRDRDGGTVEMGWGEALREMRQ